LFQEHMFKLISCCQKEVSSVQHPPPFYLHMPVLIKIYQILKPTSI